MLCTCTKIHNLVAYHNYTHLVTFSGVLVEVGFHFKQWPNAVFDVCDSVHGHCVTTVGVGCWQATVEMTTVHFLYVGSGADVDLGLSSVQVHQDLSVACRWIDVINVV